MKDRVDMLRVIKDKDSVAIMFDKGNGLLLKEQKVYGDGTSVDTDGDGVPV